MVGMSKSDIEKKIEGKGDFVKIDYLTKMLDSSPVNLKKFIYIKLADLYEKKGMFVEAAKIHDRIAVISITFADKIKYHTNEAELYIKTGDFRKVDEAMKKAMGNANASQRAEIFFVVKTAYKNQAIIYEKELKRNHASKIYEKLLEISKTESEKLQIKKKLLELYEKLGRLKEYFILKKSLNENL